MSKLGFWLTDDSAPAAEIGADLGFEFVLLDVEHGMFDLATLERFVPLLTGLGLEVFAKVLVPERGPIQQALDFGCHGVIIPHIGGVDHAEAVTQFAKFPPRGQRGLAGGRTARWGGISDEWIAAQDASTMCYPLIEEAAAVADIEKIARLDTVDGIQIGPVDLSASSGRGAYRSTQADWDDIERCVDAFTAVGKPWLYGAWTEKDQAWALERGADRIVIASQYYSLAAAFAQAKSAVDVLAAQRTAR